MYLLNTKIIFRWNVHSLCSITNIYINDNLINNVLSKPNSTTVNCLSNTKITAENHFQVSYY